VDCDSKLSCSHEKMVKSWKFLPTLIPYWNSRSFYWWKRFINNGSIWISRITFSVGNWNGIGFFSMNKPSILICIQILFKFQEKHKLFYGWIFLLSCLFTFVNKIVFRKAIWNSILNLASLDFLKIHVFFSPFLMFIFFDFVYYLNQFCLKSFLFFFFMGSMSCMIL
jgi:hypothetical protein